MAFLSDLHKSDWCDCVVLNLHLKNIKKYNNDIFRFILAMVNLNRLVLVYTIGYFFKHKKQKQHP